MTRVPTVEAAKTPKGSWRDMLLLEAAVVGRKMEGEQLMSFNETSG